jgi:hypothetical protein
MVLLRLFLAWRLLRFFLPLIVCAAVVLTVSAPLRGLGTGLQRSGETKVTGAVSRVERALEPFLREARRALTRALVAGGAR